MLLEYHELLVYTGPLVLCARRGTHMCKAIAPLLLIRNLPTSRRLAATYMLSCDSSLLLEPMVRLDTKLLPYCWMGIRTPGIFLAV